MRDIRFVAASLALAASTGLGCFNARTFVDRFTFPEPGPPPPPAQYDLSLSATITPTLAIGYHEPRSAGACLEQILLGPGDPPREDRVTSLWSFGQCMSLKPLGDASAVSSCAAVHLTRLPGIAGTPPAVSCAIPPVDKGLVLGALGEAGQALFSYHRALRPEQRSFGEAGDPGKALHAAMIKSVEGAVRLLSKEPAHASAAGPTRAELPILALSGGAANGAFTAGFLYALLDTRERAIAARKKAGDLAAVERIRTHERFGGATGASVGALIATLADLYFADASPRAKDPLPEPTRKALQACIGAGPIEGAGDRLPQACALALMRWEFTAHSEWHHLCVEDASLDDLLGDKASSFMAFLPMQRRLLTPFFQQLGGLVTDNEFGRRVTAVDFQQNVGLALDERACVGLSETPRIACLESAVTTSIVEPVFARPVDRVWSGLRGSEGEAGHWVDGGMRSGTPALAALQMTDWPAPRPPITGKGGPFHPLRVLSINTGHAEGVPSNPLRGVFPVIMGMIGSLVSQTQVWEQAMVVPYAELRRTTLCDIVPGACASGPPPAVTLPAPSIYRRAGMLTAVWAPEKIEPAIGASEAYQFDPVMMLGLFLLGERTFVESDPHELLGELGWMTVRQELDDARIAAWKKDVAARVATYRARVTDEVWKKAYREGRKKTFDDCIHLCTDKSIDVSKACDVDPLAAVALAGLRPPLFTEPPSTSQSPAQRGTP